MTDTKKLIKDLVDELEGREWTFIDGCPEHFECSSCNGGGYRQGNRPKHADDCTYVKALEDADAYLGTSCECDALHAKVKELEKFMIEYYYCPEATGFEGPDTFTNCRKCLWCAISKKYGVEFQHGS